MVLKNLLTLLKNRVVKALFLAIIVSFTLALIIPLGINVVDTWLRSKYGIPEGVQLGQVEIGRYYLEEVEELLVTEADGIVRWPETAWVDSEGSLTNEIWGKILDLDMTMLKVATAQPGEWIEPVMVPVFPMLLAREIRTLRSPIGVYGTQVGGTESRLANVRIAGGFIDFTLLMPGEVFSFNHEVGAPIPGRGFQEAPIIVGEELVPGYGGGICQVSSTLYNAVLKAGLKVVERHSHSQEVSYVPPGRDATVAYDYLDFKFENSTEQPILVRVYLSGRWLQAVIYGPTV